MNIKYAKRLDWFDFHLKTQTRQIINEHFIHMHATEENMISSWATNFQIDQNDTFIMKYVP